MDSPDSVMIASMNDQLPKLSLLIVDDDPLISDSLSYFLARDYSITVASTRPAAITKLREGVAPAIALIDLGLPPKPHDPEEGFALIGDILAHSPETRIVVLSGQSEESHARHARTLGATEFVPKPVDPEFLRRLFSRVLAFRDKTPTIDDGFIGQSQPIKKLRAQLRQFSRSPFPVLIEGESGTGKELAAAAVHRLSDRSAKPFLALNCAAISPNLVEATLFGHGRGAFTGATGARNGYFEDASDGTLFLDEIGELPLELQPKLLRVLENGEFQRIGETQTRRSAARIVAATNRDLRKEVREGRFRGDLYHRLSVFAITLPPLREQGTDRHLLFEHFQQIYASQANLAPVTLSSEAKERFDAYQFTGNVRELRNIVIRLITKHSGSMVNRADLETELDVDTEALTAKISSTLTIPVSAENITAIARDELLRSSNFDLDRTLQAWESAYIEAAQHLSHGNISQAARLLGLNRTTLYNRLENIAREKRRET